MSEHVWVSTMMMDSKLIKLIEADIVELDRDAAIAATDAIPRGEPVIRDHCPNAVFLTRDSKLRETGTPPPLFVARGYYIVNQAAAAVLEQFDLGSGALYPVQVLKRDRKAPFEGTYYTWIFGNHKETANFAESRNLREFSPMPDDPWRKLPFKPANGDVALSHAALDGPDVWVEKNLWNSMFVSGPLGDALKKAKLANAFRLTKARVI